MGWSGWIESQCNARVRELQRVEKSLRFLSIAQEWKDRMGTDARVLRGWEIIRSMEHMLENMPVTRTREQRKIHKYFLLAITKRVFGPAWPSQRQKVLDYFGADEHHSEVPVEAMRRMGKTVVLSMFLAALARHMTNMDIPLFSVGMAAGKLVLSRIRQFISDTPGGYRHVVKATARELYVSPTPLPEGTSINSAAARKLAQSTECIRFKVYPGGRSANSKCMRACVYGRDSVYWSLDAADQRKHGMARRLVGKIGLQLLHVADPNAVQAPGDGMHA